MLKKTITYEDYNGKVLTEDFYFNLSKSELIELEVAEKGGLAKKLQEIVASEDGAQIIAVFKELILTAYGIKSEDGKRFIKSEDLRDGFSQTDAYSTLFMELATDAKAAAEFVNGIVPKALSKTIEEIAPKDISEMSREELLAALNQKTGE